MTSAHHPFRSTSSDWLLILTQHDPMSRPLGYLNHITILRDIVKRIFGINSLLPFLMTVVLCTVYPNKSPP